MARLYTGQAQDISWADHRIIPTEEEYLRMVDGSMYCPSCGRHPSSHPIETGGLFVLLMRLMQQEATQNRLDIPNHAKIHPIDHPGTSICATS
jgi:hypothetical protein